MNFPLRPGAAKLAFNYDEPYDCHAAFQARHEYPLRRMAVMIPLTMSFSSRSQAFEILATGNSRYQVQAANHLKAGEGPGFEISGAGVLPPLGDQAKAHSCSRPPAPPDPKLSPASRVAFPTEIHRLAFFGQRRFRVEADPITFAIASFGRRDFRPSCCMLSTALARAQSKELLWLRSGCTTNPCRVGPGSFTLGPIRPGELHPEPLPGRTMARIGLRIRPSCISLASV